MRNPLSDHDRERIHTAVTAIEQREQIDIAVIVTPLSDRYALYPLIWAALIALTIAAIITVFRPLMPLAIGLLIQLVALIVLAMIFDFPPIRLRLVPKRMRHLRARQLAHREFAIHALSSNADHGVVLFFAAIGERCFEVIGDRQIHARITDSGWERIAAEFTTIAKQRDICSALLAAIRQCDALLAASQVRPLVDS